MNTTPETKDAPICVCDNCGWTGTDPLPFSASWSDYMNDQDFCNPIILPVGDCPDDDCGCSVFYKEAMDAMTLAQAAPKLLKDLNAILSRIGQTADDGDQTAQLLDNCEEVLNARATIKIAKGAA